jgi:hypothetical protein
MSNQPPIDFNHLRLKLAIRKAMITLRDRECSRALLFQRFRWASRDLFEAVVAECLREGTLTQKTGSRGAEILAWHEEAIR